MNTICPLINFYHIGVSLACNQDNHKSSKEFKFRTHPSIHFRVTCLRALENIVDTSIFLASCLKLLKQSLSGHAGSQVSDRCPSDDFSFTIMFFFFVCFFARMSFTSFHSTFFKVQIIEITLFENRIISPGTP